MYQKARPMNFKIGMLMEHAERYQVPRPPIMACKVGFLHTGGAYHVGRTERPRNLFVCCSQDYSKKCGLIYMKLSRQVWHVLGTNHLDFMDVPYSGCRSRSLHGLCRLYFGFLMLIVFVILVIFLLFFLVSDLLQQTKLADHQFLGAC